MHPEAQVVSRNAVGAHFEGAQSAPRGQAGRQLGAEESRTAGKRELRALKGRRLQDPQRRPDQAALLGQTDAVPSRDHDSVLLPAARQRRRQDLPAHDLNRGTAAEALDAPHRPVAQESPDRSGSEHGVRAGSTERCRLQDEGTGPERERRSARDHQRAGGADECARAAHRPDARPPRVNEALTEGGRMIEACRPATDTGRIITIGVLVVGIGFVAVLTGAVAQRFLASQIEHVAEATEEVEATDAQLLAELRDVRARLARLESRLAQRAT